jgi:NAD-dependent SIR2 family protein deacetylase
VITIDVFRVCPMCERVFRGEKVVGVDEAGTPVRCPKCGTPGLRLIALATAAAP